MASSSSPKTTRKPGKGRSKIEIKKVEQTSKRFVTFSKRKLGLFRKAAELSLLCDSQIAVVVFSQFGKVYSSGYPDPDAVIRRYLSCASSSMSDSTSAHDPEREC
ncbi:MADS-box protein AGL72-like [Neltuma alba]|uniref:MADS-box protein AGL72-like n=1 Tax=Neltuma alba TaxID=207710 RepID=UPI0010A2DE9B|nr:MADS-box protein AGL72-like [Prosopis alba]